LKSAARRQTVRSTPRDEVAAPLVWVFDGPFATCLADLEDALRRALVQVGDVAAIAVPAMRSSRRGDDLSSGCPFATGCRPRRACDPCARPARLPRWSLPFGARSCR